MHLLETPDRRAVWDRLRAEDHPFYQRLIRGALKDTTSSPEYASDGRWSGLARLYGADASFSRRAYDHIKNSRAGATFETAAVLDGNKLRESGTEFVMTLSWIAGDLTAAECDAYRDWLFRTADARLADTIRLNDSDQTTGDYFFLATLDRVFGTTYRSHPKTMQMRDAVRKYCTVFGDGGWWPEGSEYSLGTMNLLFQGAEAAGLEDYPEVVAFREQLIQFLPHIFVSDLKDLFEHGDEQTPHDPHWIALETLLAYLSQYSPAIRQFEVDLRVAWNRPAGAPLYPRYFIWANPYGPVAEWRTSTYAVAPGVGQVVSRVGWEPEDEAVWMSFTPYSLGVLDHAHGSFGEIRIRANRQWVLDRPQAYSASVLLGNHTVIGGLPAPREIGVFSGSTRIGDAVTYASGTNAGVLQAPGRTLIQTLINEKTVSFIWLMDRQVWLRIERIHLNDTVDLARFAENADDPKILSKPLVESFWQTQSVLPVVVDGVIHGDGVPITPLYPCMMQVVDVNNPRLVLGTIAEKERGCYTSVIPSEVKKFQVLVTLLGEANVTIEPLGDVQRIRVRKAGYRDAVIYSSVRPGPVLTTSFTTNASGGKLSAYDQTKYSGIYAARSVLIDDAWTQEPSADVYVEQPDGLVQLPTAPSVERQLAAALEELAIARANCETAEARAQAAEQIVQQVRALVNA